MLHNYLKNRKLFFATIALGATVNVGIAQSVAYVDHSGYKIPALTTAVNETKNDAPSVKSVSIGNQVWMMTNLDVTVYRNGDPIPHVQDPKEWATLTTGAWCYYENKEANGKVYGKLYNWYAVNDRRGLAPDGWHIPSDTEWNSLIENLGGEKVAGKKMKALTAQTNSNTDFKNAEFLGLMGGTRNDYKGNFFGLNTSGIWWSSTAVYGAYAWYRGVYYNNNEVNRNYLNKTIGLSVRCVKD
ncbi:MAG: fibrobacter succinogenes major paralogous domain-containing protein [Flavobacterium sp.]